MRQDQNTRGAQTRSLLSIPAGVTAATCTAEFSVSPRAIRVYVNCNAADAGILLSERTCLRRRCAHQQEEAFGANGGMRWTLR